jgi:CRISPR-associated protein Cmr4
MNSCLTFIHALSPLHAGTGQGIGVIDLPIARERATNLPFVPGSTVKGVLRDECESSEIHQGRCDNIFGPKVVDDQTSYAGSANFTDQRLLCLPVRSLLGTFAWVTSPFILQRLLRDALDAKIDGVPVAVPVLAGAEENCCVCEPCSLRLQQGVIMLEDLDLTSVADGCEHTVAWANWIGQKVFPDSAEWQEMFRQRFCIVHDDVLNFLVDTATEVTARNKLLDDVKTVEKGGLWYEEALPTETILYGLLVAVEVKADAATVFAAVKDITQLPLQMGGSATIGRGLCRVLLTSPAVANPNIGEA